MKLLFLCAACVCLVASLHAAAVEPVAADQPTPLDTEASPGKAAAHPDCKEPQVVGRCQALFYRFAYNAEKGQCEKFIYGGCGGNTNNFESKEACEQKCLTGDHSPTEVPSSDAAPTTVASD